MTYSFIIPHHNSPELLNRCLDSIPQREDIQIIVVDDNSKPELRPKTDRTDVEVIYIDAEHTKGAGHARNVGMEKAKGKWLLFADCDDYYTEGFIDTLDKYKDEDIEVLYFNYYFLDGKDFAPIADNKLQMLLSRIAKEEGDEVYVKFRNNTPWNKMYSHEFVKNHNIRFEEVENGNDVLFSLLTAQYSKKIEVICNRLYNYIKTPNSLGTKKQSISGLVCRMEHIVKHNSYNKKLGHPEWNGSVSKFVYGTIKQYGMITAIKSLSLLIWRSCIGCCKQNEWSKMLTEHNTLAL